MEKKIEYKTIKDRDLIIEQNKSRYLIKEINITEGNFLVFSDTPNEIKKSKDEIIEELKKEVSILKEQRRIRHDI